VAKRILVPVLPSERFYEAVVAAGDLIASEGGIFTFLFTTVRPPPDEAETETFVTPDPADAPIIDAWQDQMVAALDDARDLLYERGIEDSQVNYLFADYETTPAQSIADEAAAGAYDLVVIARGYFIYLPDQPGESPTDLVDALNSLRDDGVRLLVT
jgi:nucleotide-binding universal stress UspA family protein